MPTVEEILEAIARLSPEEQVELAGRLLTRLGEADRWPRSEGAVEGTADTDATVRPTFVDVSPQQAFEGPPDLLLVFDGGSMGNPGPGYGSFLLRRRAGEEEVLRRLDFGREMTNNEAEYETLIAALEEAQRSLGEDLSRAILEIRGDSLLVAKQVQGLWKARDARMRALRGQVWERLRPFRDWRFVRVPRCEVAALLGH